MHNYSRKRWYPDPSLPPEEQAKAALDAGALGSLKMWFHELRTVQRIRAMDEKAESERKRKET